MAISDKQKEAAIELLQVLPVKGGAVPAPVAETDIEAGLGIDFKIEVSVFPFRHKEKFQTAILADRGEGSRVFRADMLLRRAHAYVQI